MEYNICYDTMFWDVDGSTWMVMAGCIPAEAPWSPPSRSIGTLTRRWMYFGRIIIEYNEKTHVALVQSVFLKAAWIDGGICISVSGVVKELIEVNISHTRVNYKNVHLVNFEWLQYHNIVSVSGKEWPNKKKTKMIIFTKFKKKNYNYFHLITSCTTTQYPAESIYLCSRFGWYVMQHVVDVADLTIG